METTFPKRFRFRIIPGTVLLLFGIVSTLLIGTYIAVLADATIQACWLHPNALEFESLQERPLSPPVIAAFVCWLVGTFFAYRAANAWYRGRWSRAARATIVIVVWMLLMAYVANFHGSHWK
jgi:ABC-type multidrug transport system permease subunit